MHAGKNWPRQIKHWLPFPGLPNNGGTRKMKLVQVGSLHSGTVATLWFGTTTISTVAEYWSDDPLWLIYTFTNATDSNATIDIRAKLELQSPMPGFGEVYWWTFVYEPRYSGTLLARRTVHLIPDVWWKDPHSDSQVGPSWLDVTSPSQWNQISFRSGAANWADQPEYHPYRH